MYRNYHDDGDLDSLKIYFKEINKIPLLTINEEFELSRRIIEGDTSARDKLITSNLRLVIHVAKKYQNRGLPIENLVTAGMMD